jgi:hypothetical protein
MPVLSAEGTLEPSVVASMGPALPTTATVADSDLDVALEGTPEPPVERTPNPISALDAYQQARASLMARVTSADADLATSNDAPVRFDPASALNDYLDARADLARLISESETRLRQA